MLQKKLHKNSYANYKYNYVKFKVKYAINEILNQMAKTLNKGEKIEIRDFCCFSSKSIIIENRINPSNFKKIPRKNVLKIKFKAGKELKERVNNSVKNK